MKGFYDAASELYTGFDYDDFKSFIPYYYAEVDGKLCISKDHGLGEKGKPPHSVELGQYLIIYDNVDPSVIYCFVAVPEMIDSSSYSFSLDFYVFINTENGLRCSVTKEKPITTCGLVTDELEPYVAMSSERLDKKMYLEKYDDFNALFCDEQTYNEIINTELSDEEYREIISALDENNIFCTDDTINSKLEALAEENRAYLEDRMYQYLPKVYGMYDMNELTLNVAAVQINLLDCYPQQYQLVLRLFKVEKTDNGYRFIKE